jgi:serine protease SohB
MEFIHDYGLFAAKLATLLAAAALIGGIVLVVVARARAQADAHLEVRHLNRKLESMTLALHAAILPKKAFKQSLKALKERDKRVQREGASRKRVFVVDFKGDLRANAVASLREEITAILSVARPEDEVVARIESPGGTVHGYGLAASQLRRIRDKGIPLTAVIDKIAASGGYLMACVADRIVAAPFAVVGSIGVIAQLPNFNRWLKNHDVDFEQLSAGPYKRTLTLFGENTPEQRRKLQDEIDDAHALFKAFVKDNRPALDVDQVSTGEHWYGARALALALVDQLCTSDDYLSAAAAAADVYQVSFARPRGWLERLLAPATVLFRGGPFGG